MNWLRKIFDDWAPWRLRARTVQAEEESCRCRRVSGDLQKKAAELADEADELRAMLMQLRVAEMNLNGRTGYSVASFIPTEAIEKLRPNVEAQRKFIEKVATQQVRKALLGIFYLTGHPAKPQALVWAPLGPHSKKREVLAFNETGKAEPLNVAHRLNQVSKL